MNKILTTLLLAGLILACKPKSEDIKPEETACKILSYKETNSDGLIGANETYLYDKTGKLVEFRKRTKTTKYEYDSNGNLLKSVEYDVDNQGFEKKTFVIEYVYNVDNRLIKQINNVVNYSGDLRTETEIFYEYHVNGKVKNKLTFYPGFLVPDTIVEFNEKGKEILIKYKGGGYLKTEYNAADLIVKQSKYYSSNNQTTEQVNEYNSQNLKVKTSTITNGVPESVMTYEYNAKGKLITQIQYAGDGTIVRRYITEYTGENYKLSQYNSQNKLLGYETAELQNGLLMKWSAYSDNKLAFYWVYAYDNHKNMIKLEIYNSKSEMISRQEWAYQCD